MRRRQRQLQWQICKALLWSACIATSLLFCLVAFRRQSSLASIARCGLSYVYAFHTFSQRDYALQGLVAPMQSEATQAAAVLAPTTSLAPLEPPAALASPAPPFLLQKNLRPLILSALLLGQTENSTVAVFMVTTSRRKPFDYDFRPSLPSCDDMGRKHPHFGDGDFLPEPFLFDAIYRGKTRSCKVSPKENSPKDICDFHMTFSVACPLGMVVNGRTVEVQLLRRDPNHTSAIATDYGVLQVCRPPAVPNVTLAACALLDLQRDEHVNSAAQLEDWIAWHRMVGIEFFILYGVAPPRTSENPSLHTFPEASDIESTQIGQVLRRLIDERQVQYVEFPVRSVGFGVVFHVMQIAQINDCLWRLKDSALAVKLGDIDEFLHPLNPQMDARVLSEKLGHSIYPYLSLPDIRWGRSGKVPPQSISPSSLFKPGSQVPEFDAHDPNPKFAFSKSLVITHRIAFGRIHTDHDFFTEHGICTSRVYCPGRGSELRAKIEALHGKWGKMAAINHHFGGGGPDRRTQIEGDALLAPFKECLEYARHPLSGVDWQHVGDCRSRAQLIFLAQLGKNVSRVD